MKPPQLIELTPEEVEALLSRVEKGTLQEGDYEIIKGSSDSVPESHGIIRPASPSTIPEESAPPNILNQGLPLATHPKGWEESHPSPAPSWNLFSATQFHRKDTIDYDPGAEMTQ